jgi:hypothetical protein
VDLDDVRRHIQEVPGWWGCMTCTAGTITAPNRSTCTVTTRDGGRTGQHNAVEPRGPTSQAALEIETHEAEKLSGWRECERSGADAARCAAHDCGPGIARIHFAFCLLQLRRPAPQSYVPSDRGVIWSTS